MNTLQKHVYEVVKKIPKGEVATYGQIARVLSQPKAARAVGAALAKNTDPQRVPCHRVVRSDGASGGYAFGGSVQKEQILKKEGVKFLDGAVDLSSSQVSDAALSQKENE